MKAAREIPFGVSERQTTKVDLLNELTRLGLPFEAHHLGKYGSNGFDLVNIFSGTRKVIQGSTWRIQIPFAGFVEEFKSALNIIEITRREFEDRPFAEAYQALLFIDARDGKARFDPTSHGHDFSVGRCGPLLHVAFAKVETGLALSPFGGFVRERRNRQISRVRMASACRASPVNPKFLETPFALTCFGEI